jgi:hypothetical protein
MKTSAMAAMSVNNKKYRSLAFGCAILSLSSLTCAADIDDAASQPSQPSQSSQSSQSLSAGPAPYTGYAAASMGDGIIHGAGAVGHKTMRGRAGEIRLGHTFDPFGLVSGGVVDAAEAPRLDIIYYNEGHPDNNHRDGYAAQMVFRKNVRPTWGVELGVGPYFSMNRTTKNNIESDDARVGALVSLALIGRLDAYSQGLQWRLGYNHVAMTGAPSSDAIVVGIGKEIGAERSSRTGGAPDGHPIWLGAAYGFAQTNHSGPGYRTSYSLEAKQFYGQFAMSLSAIQEGDDGVRVDRRGVAAQAWYVQPFSQNWSISAGAGPYFARNKLDASGTTLNGLFTVQLDRNLGKDWKVFTNFARVVTFTNKNDSDLVTFGLMRRFGS